MHGLLVVLVVIFISASPIFADPGYTFWPGRVDTPITNAPLGFSKADFNNDHYDDFVIFNNSLNLVLLLGGPNGFVKTNFPITSSRPSSLCTGDFNNDSNADIVYAGAFSPILYTFLGNGQGGFTASGSVTINSNETVKNCVDLDRDGNLDLVAGVFNNNSVIVRFGNGNGSFSGTSSYNLPTPPSDVVADDFDGDGYQDLAVGVADTAFSTIYVLFNNTAGGFSNPIPVSAGMNAPSLITSSDFNCDGVRDLAIANQFTSMAIVFGNGQGGFSLPSVYAVPQNDAVALLTEDLNRDASKDLILLSRSKAKIIVYLNNMVGQFSASNTYSVSGGPSSLVSTNINQDKNSDICALTEAGVMSCFLGDGLGDFYLPSTFGTSLNTYPVSVFSGDFNHDGKTDVVELTSVNNWTANTIVKTYQGDGLGNFTQIFSSNLNFGTSKVLLEDVNGDNNKDLILLSGNLNILFGVGNGSFVNLASYTVPGGSSGAITIGNFNNDNFKDILVASQNYYQYLFWGSSQGTFSPVQATSIYGHPRSFVSADFNSDGRPDLGAFFGGSFDIYLGSMTGNFNPWNSYSFPTNTSFISVFLADVNNDQKQDILLNYLDTSPANRLSIFWGVGNGSFNQQPGNYPLAGDEIMAGDFNSDGSLDVVSAGNSMNVLYGNGSGGFNPTDPGIAPNYAFLKSIATGDFNGDNKTEVLVSGVSIGGLSSQFSAGFSVLPNNVSNVYINLASDKLIVPPGDTAQIKVKLENKTNQSQTFYAVAVTVLPNQTVRVEFVVPGVPLAANQTFEVTVPYFVQLGSILGDYSFKIFIGTSFLDIWDVGTLDFKVGYPIYCPAI